jgi:dTDP-4-amino-4,6-dideoxygalactose transaminase
LSVPFLDLASDFAEVEAEARRRIDGVLARQQFVLGPETAELEVALASRLEVRQAVAVSSGTDALSLALLSLGIGAGHAVVVPAFSFFATAGAVVRAGAVPVFCDIDPGTVNAGAAEMRAAIEREFDGSGRHLSTGTQLAALLPVHLYGRAAEMDGPDGLVPLAAELGVPVVEDAAQAIACRTNGRSVGRFGAAGCFSFYPTKNLGGSGDGGLVVTDDVERGLRLLRLRNHGAPPGHAEHVEVGVNARMGELVAAVLNAKLPRLDAWTARRREIASRYGEALLPLEARGLLVRPPQHGEAEAMVWHQYAVRILPGTDREQLQRRLDEDGIATRVFYPLPLHRQPSFASALSLPAAAAAARELLCLPIAPSHDDDAIDRVVASLFAAFERP